MTEKNSSLLTASGKIFFNRYGTLSEKVNKKIIDKINMTRF